MAKCKATAKDRMDKIIETITSRLEERESLLKEKMEGAKKRGDSSTEAMYILTYEIMEIERLLMVSVLVLR
jgi:DNA-binding ferritin-like protein